MKLIKQVRLEFRQGTSDKVYEVDLCEVGPGQFVVNFRYGRRGTTLRDGTKTPAPVPQAKAESLFTKLVDSKRREGYWDAGSPPPAAAQAPPAAPAAAMAPAADRNQAILIRLREGFAPAPRRKGKKPWPLARAIWRAGELGLRDAEPLLLDLLEQTLRRKAERLSKPKKDQFDRRDVEQQLGRTLLRLPASNNSWAAADWAQDFAPPEDMFLYCLAWTLGRCGSTASVPALRGLRGAAWEPVGRLATAALLRLLEGPERDALADELAGRLPPSLREPGRSGPEDAFRQALQGQLADANAPAAPVLDVLYLLDTAHTRPALQETLRAAPLRGNFVQAVRHIFKLCEFRRDAEVFGLLAHRFEQPPARDSLDRVEVAINRFHRGQVTPRTMSIAPYTEATRQYYRRRVWRTLRRLGEVNDSDYVRLAVGVLLPFTDADAHGAEVWSHGYDYDPATRRNRHFPRHRDAFGRYWAFNHILYGNSPRYEPVPRKAFFTCVQNYQPGGGEPAEREEAFAALWDAAPEALLHLLSASRCQPVHCFAVKALRANADYCRRLDVPVLVRLLEAPYEVTIELGLELAVHRYDPQRPDLALVLALANCGLARARQQAWQWIDQQRDLFIQDQPFLAALAGSPQADTRARARELLRQTALPEAAAQSLVGRLIALLRTFTAAEGERARDTAQTLQVVFAVHLRRLGQDVIRDLLEHPLAEVRQFAGELVLGHETLAGQVPTDILMRLLRDPEAAVRGVGVRLLGHLPEDVLKQDLDLLVGLARHELPDFRENIRPVLRRLAAADRDFGRRLAERLVEALLVPGAPEGIPTHTARVLREDLREYLDQVAPETVWKLLQSRSPPAQDVGAMLLATNVRPEHLELAAIVKLASHDLIAVREASWQMCRASLDRFRQDMTYATQLVDAKWEDSRQFAFGLLRDAFGRGELTPAVLVSLCDSVRPDVQQFGREMITRLFAEQDGPEYAVKLSEHPSPSMQMFSATFLERYAGTDVGRLRELTWYFQSVLSRVNQGRVAKERVFAFLEKAAGAGEESAAVVAEVLGRQSATAAVGDKARAIQILTKIRAAYPAVAMPLTVRPVEVRDGV